MYEFIENNLYHLEFKHPKKKKISIDGKHNILSVKNTY